MLCVCGTLHQPRTLAADVRGGRPVDAPFRTPGRGDPASTGLPLATPPRRSRGTASAVARVSAPVGRVAARTRQDFEGGGRHGSDETPAPAAACGAPVVPG